jgi:hypothetical protein
VIVVDDRQNIVRIVEPSGSVGTQHPKKIGSQWLPRARSRTSTPG